MSGQWELYKAGQAPFIFSRFAGGDEAALEFRQDNGSRTFFLRERQIVGFISTLPDEQKLACSKELPLLAETLAKLTMSDGEYREAKVPLPSEGQLKLQLTVCILEAMRRLPELAPVLQYIDQDHPMYRAEVSLPNRLLAPTEQFVWEQLGTRKTWEELQKLLPHDPQGLGRAVAGLVCAGLVVTEKKEAPAAPAAPAEPGKPFLPPANPALRARLAKIAREGNLPPMEVERELTGEELEQAQRDKEEGLALLGHQGKEREALRLLAKAVAVVPDPQTLVQVAAIEVANPLWRQQALAHLKQALEMDPRFTPAWLALANYWGLRGDSGKQRRCLASILKYDPHNAEVKEALAHLR